MKKIVLFLLIATVLQGKTVAQIKDKSNYVIFTFEWKRKGCSKQNFYWISLSDSLTNYRYKLNLTPLYHNDELDSQYSLDRCMEGEPMYYFYPRYELSEKYLLENQKFSKLNNDKKVKLQTVSVNWNQTKLMKKEKVKIYATPMYGVFCQCLQIHQIGNDENNEKNFRGLVYLPVSDFEYDDNFWNTPIGRDIRFVDYTLFDFASFTPAIEYYDKSLHKATFKNTDK